MDSIVFDTHAFVKELTDAGMPEPQAEVLARTHAKLIDEKLATKQDLKALELRLTLRLGSMMVVAVGAVGRRTARSPRQAPVDGRPHAAETIRHPLPRQIAAPRDAWYM